MEFSSIIIVTVTLQMIFIETFRILIYPLLVFHIIMFINDEEMEFWYGNPTDGWYQPIIFTGYDCDILIQDSRMWYQDYILSISEFVDIFTILMFLHIGLTARMRGIWVLEVFHVWLAHWNFGSFLFFALRDISPGAYATFMGFGWISCWFYLVVAFIYFHPLFRNALICPAL